jgi:ERCC4-type nuclease
MTSVKKNKANQTKAPAEKKTKAESVDRKLIVIKDTREKTGYTFASISPLPEVEIKTLKTGDYSVKGMEKAVTVERKSFIDAFGTFGKGRKRFEKELERMSHMQYACVVIEADWTPILRSPPKWSAMNPKSIYASIIAWQQRYGVHFWLCPNRAFAEKTTFRILERFWIDNVDIGATKK